MQSTPSHAADHAEDVKKHVRVYLVVFIALGALTALTVGVSYLHLPTHQAILVALAIASVKGSLVAAYFMHLISERKVIYWVLGLTGTFFAAVLLFPAFAIFLR